MKKAYEKPVVADSGDVKKVTAATGVVGDEDGAGKTIQAGVGPIDVSVGIFP